MNFSSTLIDSIADAGFNSGWANPIIQIRSGAIPAAPSDAASGVLIASISIPSPFMAASTGGIMYKNGSWSGTAVATATAGHFRIRSNTGDTDAASTTTLRIDGTIGDSATPADISFDLINITSGDTVTVSQFLVELNEAFISFLATGTAL